MKKKKKLFLKSQISGYTKKDGTYVAPHSDKRSKRDRRVVLHSSAGSSGPGGMETAMAHFLFNGLKNEDGSEAYPEYSEIVDMLWWHGTAEDNLQSILNNGLIEGVPAEHKNARSTDVGGSTVGKVMVAADRKDSRSFAKSAALHRLDEDQSLQSASGVLLMIRVPAEEKKRIDWFKNGVETFAVAEGGIPPEWIIGYQTMRITRENMEEWRDDKNWDKEFTMLHGDDGRVMLKAEQNADGSIIVYAVVLFDDSEMKKSHVDDYYKKDGTFVHQHENSVVKKYFFKKKQPQSYHPQKNDKGDDVGIFRDSKPTDVENFKSPDRIATVTPGGSSPRAINGIPVRVWRDAPTTIRGWAGVDGQNLEDEPEFEPVKNKNIGSGVIVVEDDGRVWVVHPTNQFGGYKTTFPKGTLEDGLPMQASAIKEAYEESGLKVEITGYVGDVERSTSKARYYLAKRVGGDPAAMGWESQAVSLVPFDMLGDILHTEPDKKIIEMLKEKLNK